MLDKSVQVRLTVLALLTIDPVRRSDFGRG